MSFAGDLRAVVRHRDFRRLFATRLTSQAADGVFQAALASLFFFSPERQTSAGSVAAAFATLLLPYSLVGPFAGVLLDRWRRRQVLVYANLVRAGMVLGVAGLSAADVTGVPLYAAVLACLSVNRFFLAGLSAALPHVVDPRRAGDGQLGVDHHRHGRRHHRRRHRLRPQAALRRRERRRRRGHRAWRRSSTPSRACWPPGWTATCSGPTSRTSRRARRRRCATSPSGSSTAPGTSGRTGRRATPWRPSARTGSSTASRPSRRSCCSGTTSTTRTTSTPAWPGWRGCSRRPGPASSSRRWSRPRSPQRIRKQAWITVCFAMAACGRGGVRRHHRRVAAVRRRVRARRRRAGLQDLRRHHRADLGRRRLPRPGLLLLRRHLQHRVRVGRGVRRRGAAERRQLARGLRRHRGRATPSPHSATPAPPVASTPAPPSRPTLRTRDQLPDVAARGACLACAPCKATVDHVYVVIARTRSRGGSGGGGGVGLGGPPGEELGLGGLPGQRPLLHPHLLEVLPRPADHRAGRHAEQLP